MNEIGLFGASEPHSATVSKGSPAPVRQDAALAGPNRAVAAAPGPGRGGPDAGRDGLPGGGGQGGVRADDVVPPFRGVRGAADSFAGHYLGPNPGGRRRGTVGGRGRGCPFVSKSSFSKLA